MAKCKNCKHLKYKDDGKERYAWCPLIGDNPNLEFERFCGAFKKMTNADRIRSMTDEELAKFLVAVACETHGWCDECTSLLGNYCHGLNDESNSLVQERLKWLKSEVGCE